MGSLSPFTSNVIRLQSWLLRRDDLVVSLHPTMAENLSNLSNQERLISPRSSKPITQR